MALKNYHKTIKETPDEIKYYVEDSLHILDRLHELLNEKFDGKQKLLAEKLGKSEAEVSKMLNGVQNFTLKTLSKLRAAFNEPIIAICTSHHDNSSFTQVKTSHSLGSKSLFVKPNGNLAEEPNNSKEFNQINIISGKGENQLI